MAKVGAEVKEEEEEAMTLLMPKVVTLSLDNLRQSTEGEERQRGAEEGEEEEPEE